MNVLTINASKTKVMAFASRSKVKKCKNTEDRREAHICNFLYKRKNKVALLNRREIRTRAHDAPLFLVPVPRCESFKRSVCYHGSSSWNVLTVDVHNVDNYAAFKLNRKKAMLQPLKLIEM